MILESSFPDLSEGEALRELNPSGESGSGSGSPPPSTPPPLPPLCNGRLAGWVSGLADTTSVSFTTTSSWGNGDRRPGSSTAGRDSRCPNGAATTKMPPTAPLSTQPVNPATSTAEADVGSSRGDGVATAAVDNHPTGAQPRRKSISATLPSPVSTQRAHGRLLLSGDGAGDGGEGSTSSPTELPFSVAGEAGGPVVVASRAVQRGDVVAIERPLAAAQTSQTLPWVAACPGCLRHVGTLETQLGIASGERDRAEAFRPGSSMVGAEVAVAAAATAEGGKSSTPPEPGGAGGAVCFRQSAESPGGSGEGGGDGEACGWSRGGGEDARLPLLEGLSERFVQVGENWGEGNGRYRVQEALEGKMLCDAALKIDGVCFCGWSSK